eukprot:9898925-Alexandrium_andersonii.AAC.1
MNHAAHGIHAVFSTRSDRANQVQQSLAKSAAMHKPKPKPPPLGLSVPSGSDNTQPMAKAVQPKLGSEGASR